MAEQRDKSKKHVGDLVSPIDDGAHWPRCVKIGEVYTVTYVVDNAGGGLVLDRCSSKDDSSESDCAYVDCTNVKTHLLHGKWGAEFFRIVEKPVTAEELATADILDFSRLKESEVFFK